MAIKHIFLLFFLLITLQSAKAQTIAIVAQGQPCSIRGLSVVNNQVAWVSGSKGHVAITSNGGKTWKWQQVKGFEQSDFRDVEAFSEKEAIIMSSGTPAIILKTTDGGINWKTVYRHNDKAYFLDAMAFADQQHGYILGDPIDRKFLLLETTNGGESWNTLTNLPASLPGEAAFAASGTCIIASKNSLAFVTGGSNSRWLSSATDKFSWSDALLPLKQGKASAGAFSIAIGKNHFVIAGGDYVDNKSADSVACYVKAPSHLVDMQKALHSPAGFQSCVAFIKGNTFIATGTSGTNITTDGGKNWNLIGTKSFNVCQKAKAGKLVLIAGDQGKIAFLKI